MLVRKMMALFLLLTIPCFFCLVTTAPQLAWGYGLTRMGAPAETSLAWSIGMGAFCIFGSFATVGLAALGCTVAVAA